MKLELDDPRFLSATRRVVVFGSRSLRDEKSCFDLLDEFHRKLTARVVYISGAAKHGPDRHVINWCILRNYDYVEFPADWDHVGMSAGYVRNADMAEHATIGLGFWDGVSKGTRHMRELLAKKKIPSKLYRL